MKKTLAYLLLAAGILSLAGCQKTGITSTVSGDNTIRFGASSVAGTKTAYSGENASGTAVQSGQVERIDWAVDDVLRIYSDNAAHRYLTSQHFADYKVTSVTPDGRNSNAEIAPATEYNGMKNGLVWGDQPGSYTFWGVYPSTNCPDGASGTFKLYIKDKQDGDAANVKTYGFLTATAAATIEENDFDANRIVKTKKNGGTKKDVTLAFEPAFTAFEIELVSKDAAITINSFTLSSESKSLAGDFTVSYNGTTRTCADANAPAVKAITVEDLGEIAPATADVAAKTVKFTIFAQPQTFNDLKISLAINVSGSAQTRSLKLTKDGEGVEFPACKKHRLKGVALPSELWNIYYAPFSVDEWELLDTTTNLIVQ